MSDFQLHTPETDAGLRRPFVEVAVVMRRERIDNRWQPWRWSLSEIIPHEDGFGSSPRLLQTIPIYQNFDNNSQNFKSFEMIMAHPV